MADSVSQHEAANVQHTLARTLAPEDVRIGDYVAPLHEICDLPSFLWCCDDALADRAETVVVRFVPYDEPMPLKVEAVCLPFVLVKHPTRGTSTLDVRRYQLARLDRKFARQAWKELKPRDPQRSKKHGKKKSE